MPDPILAPPGLAAALGPKLLGLDPHSIYRCSPVFRATFAPDRLAVIKRSLRHLDHARAIADRPARGPRFRDTDGGPDRGRSRLAVRLTVETGDEPTAWIGSGSTVRRGTARSNGWSTPPATSGDCTGSAPPDIGWN